MTNTLATYHDTIRLIRPAANELRWREIPWQTEIADACRLATAQERPVFL